VVHAALISEKMMSETALAPDPDTLAPGLRSILPNFDQVAGWLKEDEAEELFRAAAAVRSGCIVEVGSYRGRSTLALCAGSSIGGRVPVYAIDPQEEAVGFFGGRFGPKDRVAFFRNFLKSGLVQYVRLLNTTSTAAANGWDQPVALLFIDGDHRFASVDADSAAWLPHLAPGATVAFYQVGVGGPKRVSQMLVDSGALTFRNRVGKLGFFEFTGNRAALDPPPRHARSAAPFGKARGNADYQVAWRHVVYGVYYGGNGAYLYQPIPKCACTTIKTLLLEMEGLPVDDDIWRRHQKEHNKFPGVSHLPEPEQRDIFEGRTETFKFVMVRNPYARVASVYSDKLSKKSDSHWVKQIRGSAVEQGMTLSNPISFEEFVAVISRQKLKEMDPHWRPQYYEGRFPIINFDFVGRMEMMPDDLIYALERIGAPEPIIQRTNERYNVTGSDLAIWETVSPEVRTLFLASFGVDFDTLHYPRRLPSVRRPA
jgi:predicted O-methyltransferase YrrM